MLSSVLAGGTSIEDIVINEWSWYEDNGIRVYPGDPVIRIDAERKEVVSQAGVRASYDELILATGSQAFILPIPGADKEGVIGFRDIKDCETMMAASQKYRKAAVIGVDCLDWRPHAGCSIWEWMSRLFILTDI